MYPAKAHEHCSASPALKRSESCGTFGEQWNFCFIPWKQPAKPRGLFVPDIKLSRSDNLYFAQLLNDIRNARRRDAQPVRETRLRDCKIRLALTRRSSGKSTDDQEAFALVLTTDACLRNRIASRSGTTSSFVIAGRRATAPLEIGLRTEIDGHGESEDEQ